MDFNRKTIFEQHLSHLNCALGLTRQPVAVSFFFTQEDYEKSLMQESVTTASYCTMVRTATLGHGRKAKLEHVKCPGATRALGLVPPTEDYLSGKRYHSLGLYKDTECARETTAHVSIMKESLYGYSVQPLSTCISTPDVILIICNANQAMRVIQGSIYNSGPKHQFSSLGMQGVCSELTARPLLTQKLNVSLLCSNTRYSCAWSDDELGIGIPISIFDKVVDGIVKTINSTEPDKNKYAIAQKAKELNLEFDIHLGSAYFLPKAHQTIISPKKQQSAITVSHLKKTLTSKNKERIFILNDINLEVHNEEFVSIVGPSGCGKSTLLSIIAGLSHSDSGEVTIDGNSKRKGNLNLGMITQTDTLLPWRTVLGNVEIGLELRGVNKAERLIIAETLIDQVGLNGFGKSYPFELSGGMKKRAAVIRTLAYDPDIIFMDEPFVGLDLQTRDELEEDILKIWQEQRKTIIMVTHDLTEAITLSDRVILLSARPAAVIKEYTIDLPRPRSVVETKFTDDFVKLHKQIWHDLSAEVIRGNQEHINAD
jgi:NitT/TauT family transport system ATP-binding protein